MHESKKVSNESYQLKCINTSKSNITQPQWQITRHWVVRLLSSLRCDVHTKIKTNVYSMWYNSMEYIHFYSHALNHPCFLVTQSICKNEWVLFNELLVLAPYRVLHWKVLQTNRHESKHEMRRGFYIQRQDSM